VTDHTMNIITLGALAIAFPIAAVLKWYLALLMKLNTFKRTRLGGWLIKMVIAIGFAFLCVGVLSAMTLADVYQWWHAPLWLRWVVRISASLAAVMSVVALVGVVQSVKPYMKSALIIDGLPTYKEER
jgi:hypothetical protein